jgi:hypothetical protein
MKMRPTAESASGFAASSRRSSKGTLKPGSRAARKFVSPYVDRLPRSRRPCLLLLLSSRQLGVQPARVAAARRLAAVPIAQQHRAAQGRNRLFGRARTRAPDSGAVVAMSGFAGLAGRFAVRRRRMRPRGRRASSAGCRRPRERRARLGFGIRLTCRASQRAILGTSGPIGTSPPVACCRPVPHSGQTLSTLFPALHAGRSGSATVAARTGGTVRAPIPSVECILKCCQMAEGDRPGVPAS